MLPEYVVRAVKAHIKALRAENKDISAIYRDAIQTKSEVFRAIHQAASEPEGTSEDQPTANQLFALWDNNADSWIGIRILVGIFRSKIDAAKFLQKRSAANDEEIEYYLNLIDGVYFSLQPIEELVR